MNIFDVNVVYRIWEFIPLDDMTIRVMHMSHAMSLAEDESICTVLVAKILGETKQKLLDVKFRKFGWLQDELLLWERYRA